MAFAPAADHQLRVISTPHTLMLCVENSTILSEQRPLSSEG